MWSLYAIVRGINCIKIRTGIETVSLEDDIGVYTNKADKVATCGCLAGLAVRNLSTAGAIGFDSDRQGSILTIWNASSEIPICVELASDA